MWLRFWIQAAFTMPSHNSEIQHCSGISGFALRSTLHDQVGSLDFITIPAYFIPSKQSQYKNSIILNPPPDPWQKVSGGFSSVAWLTQISPLRVAALRRPRFQVFWFQNKLAEIWSYANTALLPAGSWVPVGGLLATRLKSNIWASGHILIGMSSWTKTSLFPSTQLPRVMKRCWVPRLPPCTGWIWLTQNVKLETAPDWQARDPTSISGLIRILGQDTWTFCCCAYRKPKVLSWPSARCLLTKNQNIHRLKGPELRFNSEVNQEEEGFRSPFPPCATSS